MIEGYSNIAVAATLGAAIASKIRRHSDEIVHWSFVAFGMGRLRHAAEHNGLADQELFFCRPAPKLI